MTNSRATMRVFSTMSRTAGMKFTKLSPRTRNTPAFSSCPGGRVFGMQTLDNRNILKRGFSKLPKLALLNHWTSDSKSNTLLSEPTGHLLASGA